MKFVTGLLVGFLAAEVLCAQSALISAQETERARQLLNSAQWPNKAWGAYFAGRLHSDELDRLLIEQFRPATVLRYSQANTEGRAFLAALFEAVIEGGITVPAALLEPFEDDWTDPVLILLARDKGSEDSLLRLRGEKSQGIVWLAANDLLYERKSQPWFAAILGEISITHRFTVTDPGDGRGSGGGVGGGSCGDGMAWMPKGFPPVTLYTLRNSPEMGNVLLTQGPKNVYYKRTVVPTDKQVGFGSCDSGFDRMAIRIGYLAQLRLVGRVEETERLLHSETQIVYTSIENFEREVERSMNAQEYGIKALIQDIEKSGLRARGIHLKIVPEVNDKRQNVTGPLPVVAPREFDLD
jgi:hypothetical protein